MMVEAKLFAGAVPVAAAEILGNLRDAVALRHVRVLALSGCFPQVFPFLHRPILSFLFHQ